MSETHGQDIWRMCCPQSCPTVCNPMDNSPPGSSLHGILQARILQWVAISSSRGSNLCLLHWQAGSLPLAPPGRPPFRGWKGRFLNVSNSETNSSTLRKGRGLKVPESSVIAAQLGKLRLRGFRLLYKRSSKKICRVNS